MVLAISKARFDFQKQAAYHQQICHNEHCKSLSLRIHKTNRKVPTCGFLISLVNPAEETGYSYGLSLAVFSLKPHSNITGRKFVIKKVQLHHRYDIRKEMRGQKISLP